MNKNKRIILIVLIIVLLTVMLIPIKSKQYYGTSYTAVLYQVFIIREISPAPHGMSSNKQITKGTKVFILFIKVYDDTETVLYDGNIDGI